MLIVPRNSSMQLMKMCSLCISVSLM